MLHSAKRESIDPHVPFYKATARANTPTTPAILATIAFVGAGAPPVEDEDEPAADAADAADADAEAISELAEDLRELAEDLRELTSAVRDDATDDKGKFVVAESTLLM